ncbi:hypothetical protein BN7_4420 [Wickerhamomyces ciferrii]|uniref:Uncharacterized protein n=1 Tax=Wickerhamomyces ciferrii (strain ATCC 14091 / BCRC 22168 / CBS 111 / JCM 3599 / NBRC 0793 / NRRL Y-1031 F-60-10) TaxID=1206466 RepID=K0KPF8_WICCF|nr:uncharacterized protein BN7_4420 [Wickerhamomyces ciferrii]CCH44851.1 hypothetical protein BN7_4420 [Wickerhamomyces ciferrii]
MKLSIIGFFENLRYLEILERHCPHNLNDPSKYNPFVIGYSDLPGKVRSVRLLIYGPKLNVIKSKGRIFKSFTLANCPSLEELSIVHNVSVVDDLPSLKILRILDTNKAYGIALKASNLRKLQYPLKAEFLYLDTPLCSTSHDTEDVEMYEIGDYEEMNEDPSDGIKIMYQDLLDEFPNGSLMNMSHGFPYCGFQGPTFK